MHKRLPLLTSRTGELPCAPQPLPSYKLSDTKCPLLASLFASIVSEPRERTCVKSAETILPPSITTQKRRGEKTAAAKRFSWSPTNRLEDMPIMCRCCATSFDVTFQYLFEINPQQRQKSIWQPCILCPAIFVLQTLYIFWAKALFCPPPGVCQQHGDFNFKMDKYKRFEYIRM